jgi:hypothetical protein
MPKGRQVVLAFSALICMLKKQFFSLNRWVLYARADEVAESKGCFLNISAIRFIEQSMGEPMQTRVDERKNNIANL